MKVLEVKTLAIPEVKVVKYQRFVDERGYFTETYRKSEFEENSETPFLKGVNFTQMNETFSKKGTVRGLHFQWNPLMAKFVRLIKGKMIDLALDIRKDSPTFGKIVGYEFEVNQEQDSNEWIWVPIGFAHGLVFEEDGLMEYFCTGQWAPDTERGISPFSKDIDWSLIEPEMKSKIDAILGESKYVTDKDKEGMSLEEWSNSPDSENFKYSS